MKTSPSITERYLNFIKGLFKVYIIILIKHKKDKSHGIVNNSVGLNISTLFSLFVQLFNVI